MYTHTYAYIECFSSAYTIHTYKDICKDTQNIHIYIHTYAPLCLKSSILLGQISLEKHNTICRNSRASHHRYTYRGSREKGLVLFLPTLLDPDFSFLVQFFIFFSYCHYVSGNFISFLERDKCPYMNSIYKKKILNQSFKFVCV